MQSNNIQPTMMYNANNQLVTPVATTAGYTTTTQIPTQPATTLYTGAPATTFTPSTLGGAPLPAGQAFAGQPGFAHQPMMSAPLGGQFIPGQTNLNGTPLKMDKDDKEGHLKDLPHIPDANLELKKRMLENDRETQLKYADMESDKQKKLEDKAEKQREKAAKWKSRGMESMVHRHEKKASALEVKAHEHFMMAEKYRAAGKVIELERKTLDPPAEKTDKKGTKKTATKDAKDANKDAKDANKDATKDANKSATDKPASAATPNAAAPATTGATPSQQQQPAAANPTTSAPATQQQAAPADLPALTKKADDLAQALHQQQQAGGAAAPIGVGKQ